MDITTHVSSTDEDEVIDVEGEVDDIRADNIIKACDSTVPKPHDLTASRNNDVNVQSCKRKNEDTAELFQSPFKKMNLIKNGRTQSSQTDEELSKWWGKVAENGWTKARRVDNEEGPSTPDQEVSVFTLDPILQAEAKNCSRKVSSHEEAAEEVFYTESGEKFRPPQQEVQIPIEAISEAERGYFPEFFNGRTKYTANKYLSIRNAILELWKKVRPEHVYKVALRPVLKKDCGNVNNVGRIHRYLESIGAINFGSDNVWWKRKKTKKKKMPERKDLLGTDEKLKRALEQRMSGRSRKRPVQFAADASGDDLIGGYTIDHGNNDAIVLPMTPPKATKPSPNKTAMKQYDLVNCRQYASPEDCPYDVTIDASALVVMDTHSHLSKHEVMGLVGGYVNDSDNNSKKVKVHIVCAQPCKSFGSTRHCEMDPVSQSIACEYITTRGQKVVGWYHSHPTFPPQPSNTDIKTQLAQQTMFQSHGSVFLGLILSPYNRHQLKTQVNVVFISEEVDATTGYEVPYSVKHSVNCDPPDPSTDAYSEILRILTEIIDESARDSKNSANCRLPHLLQPFLQGSGITHLDKLMKSLSAFVTPQTSTPDNGVTAQMASVASTEFDGIVTSLADDCDVNKSSEQNRTCTVASHSEAIPPSDCSAGSPIYDETMDSSHLVDDFSLFGENICIDEISSNSASGSPVAYEGGHSVESSNPCEAASARVLQNLAPVWRSMLQQIRTLLLGAHQEFLCQ